MLVTGRFSYSNDKNLNLEILKYNMLLLMLCLLMTHKIINDVL